MEFSLVKGLRKLKEYMSSLVWPLNPKHPYIKALKAFKYGSQYKYHANA